MTDDQLEQRIIARTCHTSSDLVDLFQHEIREHIPPRLAAALATTPLQVVGVRHAAWCHGGPFCDCLPR